MLFYVVKNTAFVFERSRRCLEFPLHLARLDIIMSDTVPIVHHSPKYQFPPRIGSD